MSEIDRIAHLLKQTFGARPYYGPPVLGTLEGVRAQDPSRQPGWSAHNIWSIVNHLTAELIYAREVVEGTAAHYDGHTWTEIVDTSEGAWRHAVNELKRANRALVRAVQR